MTYIHAQSHLLVVFHTTKISELLFPSRQDTGLGERQDKQDTEMQERQDRSLTNTFPFNTVGTQIKYIINGRELE